VSFYNCDPPPNPDGNGVKPLLDVLREAIAPVRPQIVKDFHAGIHVEEFDPCPVCGRNRKRDSRDRLKCPKCDAPKPWMTEPQEAADAGKPKYDNVYVVVETHDMAAMTGQPAVHESNIVGVFEKKRDADNFAEYKQDAFDASEDAKWCKNTYAVKSVPMYKENNQA